MDPGLNVGLRGAEVYVLAPGSSPIAIADEPGGATLPTCDSCAALLSPALVSTQTLAKGDFSLEVPPGTYTVIAQIGRWRRIATDVVATCGTTTTIPNATILDAQHRDARKRHQPVPQRGGVVRGYPEDRARGRGGRIARVLALEGRNRGVGVRTVRGGGHAAHPALRRPQPHGAGRERRARRRLLGWDGRRRAATLHFALEGARDAQQLQRGSVRVRRRPAGVAHTSDRSRPDGDDQLRECGGAPLPGPRPRRDLGRPHDGGDPSGRRKLVVHSGSRHLGPGRREPCLGGEPDGDRPRRLGRSAGVLQLAVRLGHDGCAGNPRLRVAA